MTRKLFRQAIVKFLSRVLLLGLLLFLPAGTLRFRNAWILMGILFIPMAAAGIVMMLRSPELLRKRLNMQETEQEQKTVIALSGAMFAAAFVTAGLNFRFGWFVLPDAVVYIAAGFFLAGYLLFAEVLRENAYLSRTVEVQQEQKVIDTGLYGIVRHPMYMVTVVLFLAMPLVLGSVISFVIMLGYLPVIIKRIRNEERVLEAGLAGYGRYMKKVRYRLIPFVW